MRIGLIDADMLHRKKMTFPNLALMKLSAWHKQQGDTVEWYQPLLSGHMDRVYVSKVFSDAYTPDIFFTPDADEVIRGGSGYAISNPDGREVYDKGSDTDLPYEVEHIYPDYGLYGITDTAYGFLTRGCPRGCAFCHVAGMQGRKTHKVAEIQEFWRGQSEIVLLDPNITAYSGFTDVCETFHRIGAKVEFSQGLDIRLMTQDKWEALSTLKLKMLHFAWDNPEDDLEPKFEEACEYLSKSKRRNTSVYVLSNFNSTLNQDIYRCETILKYGFTPYLMIYDKPTAGEQIRKLQRWANNPYVHFACKRFADYDTSVKLKKR